MTSAPYGIFQRPCAALSGLGRVGHGDVYGYLLNVTYFPDEAFGGGSIVTWSGTDVDEALQRANLLKASGLPLINMLRVYQ